MIKGVIFDLDGTLLNTLDDIFYAIEYMLKKQEFPLKSKDEVRLALGYGANYLIKEVCPKEVSNSKLEESLKIYQEYYNSHQNDYTKPYDGVVELLEILRDNDYKMAIVSNKIDYLVKELNRSLFKGLIDVAVGEIAGVPPKPDPTSVLNVIEMLHFEKNELVYVGDTEVDVLTAKNSGLYCVGCTWGFRPKEVLINANADIIIDKPLDLIKILTKD